MSINTQDSKEIGESQKGIETVFNWHLKPKKWGEFSPADLNEFVAKTVDFFKIPLQDQKSIQIVFDDHASPSLGEEAESAVAISTYGRDGSLKYVNIILNRSLEVHTYVSKLDGGKSTEGYSIGDGEIYCELQEPWEEVVWSIAEELNHASAFLKLKDARKYVKASHIYSRYLVKKKHVFGLGSYGNDLLEVAASRQVLRLLEKLALEKGKTERAHYFRSMYQLSLQDKMAVTSRCVFPLEQLYMRTGFKAESESEAEERDFPFEPTLIDRRS